MANQYKRHTITAALPYANGPIHIGHLAGVYVPADIYVRYLRSKGEDVLFVCGSDEHGVPITIRARKENTSPQEIVNKFHHIIKNSFEQFGISFDIYSRTSNPTHHQTSSDFFKTLYDKGLLEEKESDQYYDEQEKQFLADRYIVGTCPNCGFSEAYGDQCESCGSTLSPAELINPRSMLSGNTPVLKTTKHWYIPLQNYEPWLREWILEGHKEWKVNVYGQCKSWLDQGLQSRALTRDLDWGVPVPLPKAEGKVLYVWFDAPIGYISATREWAREHNKNWEDYWKSEDTRLLHFIGKDNIVFHCIIFPAMLKAHGEYVLPDNVPANEFLNLENAKISTSRNWAVWLHEFLEDFEGKEDILRYTLCANAPETKDNDFTWKDFQAKNNNELVAILGNFINRSLVLTHKYFDGKVPPAGSLQPVDEAVIEKLKLAPKQIGDALDQFKFREALFQLIDLARTGNKYLADTEPWKAIKNEPERVATILNIGLQIVANLQILTAPFLPFSAHKIGQMIGQADQKWQEAGSPSLLPAGHQIGPASLLFQKIEDEDIEKQINKLTKKNEASEKEKELNPLKDEVTYDDFIKMDIRSATILEAEKVPKSKKLLKLLLDTGLDRRVVVSGIAEYYDPEKVVGQKVALLANLAPRKIMGIESKGMILMAQNQVGTLVFVEPGQAAENGAGIS